MAPWTPNPAQDPDPITIVDGLNGSTYACPDIPALDAHLRTLAERVRNATPQFPELAQAFRKEIDRLLDRRLWLQW